MGKPAADNLPMPRLERAAKLVASGMGCEKAMLVAGYAAGYARKSMQSWRRGTQVMEIIEECNRKYDDMTQSDIRQVWIKIIKDPDSKTLEVLRATENMARCEAMFIDRAKVDKEVQVNLISIQNLNLKSDKELVLILKEQRNDIEQIIEGLESGSPVVHPRTNRITQESDREQCGQEAGAGDAGLRSECSVLHE